MGEARRRDDLLDMGDRRCRNRIGRLVSFKGNITLARPETLPLPADNSARSRAATSAEVGEIEEANLGALLNSGMTFAAPRSWRWKLEPPSIPKSRVSQVLFCGARY